MLTASTHKICSTYPSRQSTGKIPRKTHKYIYFPPTHIYSIYSAHRGCFNMLQKIHLGQPWVGCAINFPPENKPILIQGKISQNFPPPNWRHTKAFNGWNFNPPFTGRQPYLFTHLRFLWTKEPSISWLHGMRKMNGKLRTEIFSLFSQLFCLLSLSGGCISAKSATRAN